MSAAKGHTCLNHRNQMAYGKVVHEVAGYGLVGATENHVAVGKRTVCLSVSKGHGHGDKLVQRTIGTTLKVLGREVYLVPSHVPWARVEQAVKVVPFHTVHVNQN